MKAIRIANGQGFWGDSLEAPIELVRRGPIDYLTLDYLAEITMSIMQKQRARDPRSSYARDFVTMIDRVLPDLLERDIKVVANAGGVNPKACRNAVAGVINRRGFAGRMKVGIVAGDDIMDRLQDYISRGIEFRNLDTGHTIECGAQCTGGNCLVDWDTIPSPADIGYPIVEANPDGTFAITKHDGTGGR